MTYLYYKTSTLTGNQKPNEKTIEQWTHLADKRERMKAMYIRKHRNKY